MRATLEKVESRESVVIDNEGQQIFGMLHRPMQTENPPLAVLMHGFASSKLGSNRCYVTLAEHLAKAGIAALRFDFRGCGDSEGRLSEITFEDLVSDALAVLNNLDILEGVDRQKIGLFGASLGGAIAILAAARLQNAHIKTMALWAPVASGQHWLSDFLKQHPEYANVDHEKLLSSYRGIELHPDFRGQFARMKAYKTIAELHSMPILHMHGEKDDIISIAHQEAFKQTCQTESCQVRFITYPEDQHMLGYSPSFSEVVRQCADWFKQHLCG